MALARAVSRRRPPEFRTARTCYDHLAGLLGVGLHDALVRAGEITPAEHDRRDIDVGPGGGKLLALLGVAAIPRAPTRRLAYACSDLTERRAHIGGALGAALCAHALREGWVERIAGTRALRITALGMERCTSLGMLPAHAPEPAAD